MAVQFGEAIHASRQLRIKYVTLEIIDVLGISLSVLQIMILALQIVPVLC